MDVKDTGKVTDVMAKSFSASALDMQKFSDSMKYVAPVAKMAGAGGPQKNPLMVQPPTISPPKPIQSIDGQHLASRAERRRAEAEERRKKRKEAKKNKKK